MAAAVGEIDDTLAVYIHWPFCLAKCPYCDFNSHVRDGVDQSRWRDALVAEIGHYAAITGPRRVASIFFGGGTPSLMPPATAAAAIDAVGQGWDLAGDAEITLEANPTSAEAERFRDFRAAGINRLSLGVQALDDDALAFLGRGHSAAEAMAAAKLAGQCFPRHSIDMIYARPHQTVDGWREELGRALDLAGDHISAYQLTIEKGTPFHGALRRGEFLTPEEDLAAALYEVTGEVLDRAAQPAYEISNHARPGGECRHNLAVWRGGDYVGVGPGAHGRLNIPGTHGRLTIKSAIEDGTLATAQLRAPEAWLEAVAENGHGTQISKIISPAERFQELVMLGLRLTHGMARGDFEPRLGSTIEAAFDPAALARLVEGGFVVLDEAGLRATRAGLTRLDSVLAALIA